LGDPFILGVPHHFLDPENSEYSLEMETANSTIDEGSCSKNNKLIYSAYLPSVYSEYAQAKKKAGGCIWTIDFEDGTTKEISVPSDYEGTDTCQFTETVQEIMDDEDSTQGVMLNILNKMDIDGNHKVDISFEEDDLVSTTETTTKIPYLWGPALLEVRVWK
jgi:hypothetical protein